MGIGSMRMPESAAVRQSGAAGQNTAVRQSKAAKQSKAAEQNAAAKQSTGAGEPDVVSRGFPQSRKCLPKSAPKQSRSFSKN